VATDGGFGQILTRQVECYFIVRLIVALCIDKHLEAPIAHIVNVNARASIRNKQCMSPESVFLSSCRTQDLVLPTSIQVFQIGFAALENLVIVALSETLASVIPLRTALVCGYLGMPCGSEATHPNRNNPR
jgi:hypothetical protein